MRRRIPRSPLLLAVAALASACGEDSTTALPSVPRHAVPVQAPIVGEQETVTVVGESCVRAGDVTYVFLDDQAELVGEGMERRLEVRWVSEDGGGHLASVGVDGASAAPIGHRVDPTAWAEPPPDDCEGPYFLVTGFDVRTE